MPSLTKSLSFEGALKVSQNSLFLLNSYDIHLYEALLSAGLEKLNATRTGLVEEQKALLAIAPTCQYTSDTPEGRQYDELMDRFDSLSLQITIAKQKLSILEEVKQVDTAMKLTKDAVASTHKYTLGLFKHTLKKYLASLVHSAYTPYKDPTSHTQVLKQKIEQVEKQLSLFAQFAIHPAI